MKRTKNKIFIFFVYTLLRLLLITVIMFMPNFLISDVLWEQVPDSIDGTGIACQLDSVYPFDADVVDDIYIPSPGWRLDSMKTWWRNWSFSSWYYVPNFHLMLYEDSSGMPCDSPMLEFIIEKEHYTVYEHWPQEKFSVIMDLTSYAVEFPDSGIWWIEVQPSNVFTSGNGQTGWQSTVGIGNGQELYQRYPLVGNYAWESATSLFNHPYEAGMIIWGEILNQVGENPNLPFITENIDILPVYIFNHGHKLLEIEFFEYQDIILEIYDLSGRIILFDKYDGLNPGIHCFNLSNNCLGNSFSGVYILKIITKQQVYSGKVIFL